ncbi:MAG: 2-hydroxyacyl-CoA dehydratase family protein [Bacillota bacterium]|nr:2-hydroxyacyl-CoA dehydratase family protein [Bacillota bacterium]
MVLLSPSARRDALRYALSRSWVLALARTGLGLARTSDTESYGREAVRWGLGELGDAVARRRPVVWCNVALPSEFIYGMRAIPVMPEMAAGFAAAWRGSQHLIVRADGEGFPSDLCSFHRCALGLALEGWLPRPDAVVATSIFCDGAKKFLHHASRLFSVPYFLIDVPYEPGASAVRAVAARLREVAAELEGMGRGFDARRLPFALALSNQARGHYLEAMRLRRHRPAPWRGSEALSYASVFFTAFGSPGGVRIYRALARSLAARLRRGRFAVPVERRRLLWLHFRPFYPGPLMSFLEVDQGAVIAVEEMTHLWWQELDPGHPWESLGGKITSHFLWGPVDRRVEVMLQLARDYGVDGIVHYSHWGCRQSTGAVSILRQASAQAGIPFLNLDGDCIDPRNGREEQARTRLEAFLESIPERRDARAAGSGD